MTAKKESHDGDNTIRRDAGGKRLTPQARRALDEAEARRAAQKLSATTAIETGARAKKEIGGRDGPEPIRYGDWEVNGRTSDF